MTAAPTRIIAWNNQQKKLCFFIQYMFQSYYYSCNLFFSLIIFSPNITLRIATFVTIFSRYLLKIVCMSKNELSYFFFRFFVLLLFLGNKGNNFFFTPSMTYK